MPLLAIGGLVIVASLFFTPLSTFLPALAIYLAFAGYSIEADGRHKELLAALKGEDG